MDHTTYDTGYDTGWREGHQAGLTAAGALNAERDQATTALITAWNRLIATDLGPTLYRDHPELPDAIAALGAHADRLEATRAADPHA